VPEQTGCEAVRAKPKLQWRPQELRDARDKKYPPRKAAGSDLSQPKREVTWAIASETMEEGLPKLFGELSVHHVPWMLHAAVTGFNVCLGGFLYSLGPTLPSFLLFLTVEKGIFTCAIVNWKYGLVFYLYKGSLLRVALNLRGDHEFKLFLNHVRTIKTVGTFRDR
jgi:hypothetical protein